jgi:small GTP-binding protein
MNYGNEISFKIVLIGDSSVGKTNLVSQFVRNSFYTELRATIGVDFATKTMIFEGKSVKLSIWDTAGQEVYHSITSAYYRGADGVVLMYDISNQKSFNSIPQWLSELRISNPYVTIILIGNKADLEEERKVSETDGKNYAEKESLLFLETSAKSSMNVEQSFQALLKVLLRDQIDRPESTSREHQHAKKSGFKICDDPVPEVQEKTKEGCC